MGFILVGAEKDAAEPKVIPRAVVSRIPVWSGTWFRSKRMQGTWPLLGIGALWPSCAHLPCRQEQRRRARVEVGTGGGGQGHCFGWTLLVEDLSL